MSVNMAGLTPEQREDWLKSMRHNYRVLRPIFKAAPKAERHEMKMAYRFGPAYHLFKWMASTVQHSGSVH